LATVAELVDVDVSQLGYYTGASCQIGGQPGIVSRTGYTGEDGCELIVPGDAAGEIWDSLLAAGSSVAAQPAGLGARDTLRLEAAMPLYGQELGETINPFEAGLGFAVQLKDHDFVGREALQRAHGAAPGVKRIGLILDGKRVPRQHYPVLQAGNPVGEVTSGTFSPTLEKPIAMAYVQPQAAGLGEPLEIEIRGRREAALVVKLPFYKRASSGSSPSPGT
jgi:aminomethyltransferase